MLGKGRVKLNTRVGAGCSGMFCTESWWFKEWIFICSVCNDNNCWQCKTNSCIEFYQTLFQCIVG